tara:strand:+ start:354 stop:464 length:111 start_codon:yes stop_codon:yes gene_type:complete
MIGKQSVEIKSVEIKSVEIKSVEIANKMGYYAIPVR